MFSNIKFISKKIKCRNQIAIINDAELPPWIMNYGYNFIL